MSVTFSEKATDKERAKADSEKVKIIEKLPPRVFLELMQIKLFIYFFKRTKRKHWSMLLGI